MSYSVAIFSGDTFPIPHHHQSWTYHLQSRFLPNFMYFTATPTPFQLGFIYSTRFLFLPLRFPFPSLLCSPSHLAPKPQANRFCDF